VTAPMRIYLMDTTLEVLVFPSYFPTVRLGRLGEEDGRSDL